MTSKSITKTGLVCLRGFNVDRKIVFTCGAFDILHPGHIRFLKECQKLGDMLVVGLNSDKSIRKYKGKDRPINPQNVRFEMLSALDFVDKIFIFDDPNPCRVIEWLKPDIHCKDDTYTRETMPEYSVVGSYGGKVIFIPRVKTYSTTNIIKKIKDRPWIK